MAQRIPYPRLARAVVDSVNAVIVAGELQVPGECGPFSFAPGIAPGGYDACLTLSFAVGGSPVRASLNPAALDCALGDLIDAAAFATLDNDLKLAVLEAALASPLRALTALLGAEVVLAGIVDDGMDAAVAASPRLDGDEAAPFAGLLFEIRHPSEGVRCAVLVDLVSPLPRSVVERLAESPASRARDLAGLPGTRHVRARCRVVVVGRVPDAGARRHRVVRPMPRRGRAVAGQRLRPPLPHGRAGGSPPDRPG